MEHKLIKIFLLLLICIITFFAFVEIRKHKTIKIAFLGDSITEYGWANPNGYVNYVVNSLRNTGLNLEPIPAGVAGETSSDILKRLDNVLELKPDVIFYMGGINDIWGNRVSLTQSKQNVIDIINKIKNKHIKLVIISLTIITEDLNNYENKEIKKYNKFLEKTCSKNNIQYIDVNSLFIKELNKYDNPINVLTTDGIHLNTYGNTILGQTIVKEFLAAYKH